MDEDINQDEYEIYFAAREQDEETEDDMSYDSFSDFNQSLPSNENSADANDDDNESNENNQPASNERRISYNRELPATHSYLGNQFEELTGRVVLEEETYVTIPLLCLPNVILIPGQLLPLQFQGSYFLSTIKNIIDGNKIFGLVPNYINRNVELKNPYNHVKLDRLGTIVEVRSYGTETDGSIPILKLKAEGKERFIVKETWTDSNRTVMGKVFILPEIDLQHSFNKDLGLSSIGGSRHNKKLLPACTPYPSFVYSLYDPEYLMDKIRSHLNKWASFSSNSKSNDTETRGRKSNVYENRTVSQTTGTNQLTPIQNTTTSTESTTQQNESTTIDQSSANQTTTTSDPSDSLPVSVNTTRTVVTRIVPANESDDDDEDDEDSENGAYSYAPTSPIEFSYWVLANLTLADHQRLILLSLNCPIQRLRWQASFFEKYLGLNCIHCNVQICNCEDIFSMSVKGYQDVFVNTHGVIHETLTVSKVSTHTKYTGRKTDEFSWFPNYGWIIMNCRCGSHLGWKFIANDKKLSPQVFYGISRRNVKPAIGNLDNSLEDSNPLI